MFGCYRTLLAMMVVLLHVGGLPYIGEYAVYGFFALSGYLITFVMQRNYQYTLRGTFAFALNRFLRIYPIYWVACALAVIVLLTLDARYTTAPNNAFFLPNDWQSWFANIALMLRFDTVPMLISPAWALTVELFYYTCIGLGLSRTRHTTLAWFALSIGYTLYLIVTGAGWQTRYFGVLAASLPFSTGALIFHYRDSLRSVLGGLTTNAWIPIVVFALIQLNWWAGGQLQTSTGLSFYLNFLLCAAMIPLLMDQASLFVVTRATDSRIGDLSYPIYLIHVLLAVVVAYLYEVNGFGRFNPGRVMLSTAFLPLLGLAWLMTALVERPVERVRTLIKRTI